MPTITLEISDLAAQTLQRFVTKHNAATGQNLDLAAWVDQKIIEQAMSDEYQLRLKDLEETTQAEKQTAAQQIYAELLSRYRPATQP